jgi:hypothetical protein
LPWDCQPNQRLTQGLAPDSGNLSCSLILQNESERNVTQAKIGRAYSSTEIRAAVPGLCEIAMKQPQSGYLAYYLEAEYARGNPGVLFKFSSGTKVFPDRYQHQRKKAPERAQNRST